MGSSLSSAPVSRVFLVVLGLTALSACSVLRPPGYDAFKTAIGHGSAIEVYDALEALIAEGDDTREDRKLAFKAVRDKNEDTAEFQFAWAALAGRVVQQRGLLAVDLVSDVESHARRSVELDPHFRDGAAIRLLGTMYVIAPASFLEYGNSELGLEMLEGLVAAYPGNPENHLRVAEAYIALNDPEPSRPHLCACLAVEDSMRGEDQILLRNLVADAGNMKCDGKDVIPAPKKRSLVDRLWPDFD